MKFKRFNKTENGVMSMRMAIILSFLAVTLLQTLPSYASFEMPQTSARSAAMGNAFLASNNEPASVFTNPAGIASMKHTEVSFLYAKPFAGLQGVNMNTGHAALVVPTVVGQLGAGFAHFQSQGLMEERILALSYGVKLGKAQVGVTAKQLSHSFSPSNDPLAANDPVFAKGTGKSAMTMDVGGVVPMGKFLRAGVAVRNLNSPDLGLATEDRVAREIQGGLMLDFSGMGLKVAGDFSLRQNSADGIKNEPIPYLGVEKSLYKNKLALRAGANTLSYTGGFGLKLGNIGIDYAMVFSKNLLSDNYGTQKMGMSYRFGNGRK